MRRTWRLLEALLHGLVAAVIAFSAMLIASRLPTRYPPSLGDAGRVALIVFCVAAGHTAGIAAGRPLLGLFAGSIAGIALAAVASLARRPAA